MFRVDSDDFDEPHWVNSREEVRGLVTGILIGRGCSLEAATRWATGTMGELHARGIADDAAPGGVRIEYTEGKV